MADRPADPLRAVPGDGLGPAVDGPARVIADAFTRAMNADLAGMARALAKLDKDMALRVADAAGCLSRAARHHARTLG